MGTTGWETASTKERTRAIPRWARCLKWDPFSGNISVDGTGFFFLLNFHFEGVCSTKRDTGFYNVDNQENQLHGRLGVSNLELRETFGQYSVMMGWHIALGVIWSTHMQLAGVQKVQPKKIPKESALKLMKVSDKIWLTGTSAPSEFLHEK